MKAVAVGEEVFWLSLLRNGDDVLARVGSGACLPQAELQVEKPRAHQQAG